jgi:hypothetical protein
LTDFELYGAPEQTEWKIHKNWSPNKMLAKIADLGIAMNIGLFPIDF